MWSCARIAHLIDGCTWKNSSMRGRARCLLRSWSKTKTKTAVKAKAGIQKSCEGFFRRTSGGKRLGVTLVAMFPPSRKSLLSESGSTQSNAVQQRQVIFNLGVS